MSDCITLHVGLDVHKESIEIATADVGGGEVRHVGRVTKRGDVYLRMLLIHGARAVLRSAKVAQTKQQPLDRTRAWALALAERVGHNKAAYTSATARFAQTIYSATCRRSPYMSC